MFSRNTRRRERASERKRFQGGRDGRTEKMDETVVGKEDEYTNRPSVVWKLPDEPADVDSQTKRSAGSVFGDVEVTDVRAGDRPDSLELGARESKFSPIPIEKSERPKDGSISESDWITHAFQSMFAMSHTHTHTHNKSTVTALRSET